MFFFENYQLINLLGVIILVVGLYVLNELSRRSKYLSISLFILVPIVFTLFVWRNQENSNTSGNWFAWIKTYSALVGVIGFMAIRYSKKLQKNRYILFFPAVILAVNILEAVFRDLQVYGYDNVVENGLLLQGGIWNILNAIAGVITILTLTGIGYIRVSNTKTKDMIWADQLWFYLVGYSVWNMSYVYNCIPNRSFYAGVILLSVALFAGLVTKKGAWLQHRAQILALFAMFTLTFPAYADTQLFSIQSTHAKEPLIVLSVLSLTVNLAVLSVQIYTMVKTKRNPLKEELYVDSIHYQNILSENNLDEQAIS